jgi:hypothetical protein
MANRRRARRTSQFCTSQPAGSGHVEHRGKETESQARTPAGAAQTAEPRSSDSL